MRRGPDPGEPKRQCLNDRARFMDGFAIGSECLDQNSRRSVMSIEKSVSGNVKSPDYAGFVTSLLPGLAFAGALAYLSVQIEPMTTKFALATIGRKITITAPVIALLIGMILHPLADRPTFTVGTTFAIKKILRWAIALFGLKIALADIIGLGLGTAIMVIVAMAITLASGVLFARLFGRGDLYGAIAGGATAVCGASAALATASVLPHYKDRESDTAFVAITVNILATVAMIAYPPLCDLLGFDQRTTGIFLGATIHDVAQVVGAGYAVSDDRRKHRDRRQAVSRLHAAACRPRGRLVVFVARAETRIRPRFRYLSSPSCSWCSSSSTRLASFRRRRNPCWSKRRAGDY